MFQTLFNKLNVQPCLAFEFTKSSDAVDNKVGCVTVQTVFFFLLKLDVEMPTSEMLTFLAN